VEGVVGSIARAATVPPYGPWLVHAPCPAEAAPESDTVSAAEIHTPVARAVAFGRRIVLLEVLEEGCVFRKKNDVRSAQRVRR
jgi:hypothetical protein